MAAAQELVGIGEGLPGGNRTIYAGHKICEISVSSLPGRSLAPAAADWVVDLPPGVSGAQKNGPKLTESLNMHLKQAQEQS